MAKIGRNNRQSGKIYHYILFSILVSLAVSVFISTFFITSRYQNIHLKKIMESESDRLIQASSTSNFMTEYAMNLALQIYFNPSFSKALFFEEHTTDDIRNVIAQLNHVRLSTSFIDSIYLYNHLNQEFFVSSSRTGNTIQPKNAFVDQFIDRIMNDATYYRENSIYNGKALFLPRELDLEKDEPAKTNIVYSLIYKNAFNSSDLSSVVINISSQWFEDILFKNINPHDNDGVTDILAIDNDNRVVMKNRYYDIMQSVGDEDWFRRIEESELSSGYLIADIDQESKLINYYKSHNLQIDWMFVSFKSYSSIVKEINDLRKIFTVFSLLLLFGTVIIEAIVSNRIYQPIRRLFNTLETSQVGRDDYRVTLKNNFFRIYLQQKIPLKKDDLSEEFRKFQINLNIDKKFLMVLLKIDNYDAVSKDLSFRSLSLLKFRILKELSDLLSEKSPLYEIVVLHGRFMLFTCNLHGDEEETQTVLDTVRRMRPSVAEKYGVEYSIFYSVPEYGFEKMPAVYDQIMNAARKTAYYGKNIDLSLADFTDREKAKFEYPAKDVAALIDVLKKGDSFDIAKTKYHQIITKAGCHSHRALNFCITSLLLETNDLIYLLKTYGNFKIEFEVEGILDDLENLEDHEALNRRFYGIFREIITHQRRAGNKHGELIDKVKEIVSENYGNPLFSIVDIAAKLNLTAAYLGRLYKKHAMQSLNDYVTQIRLEKSKELLRNSDKSINEIALATGFSTANYYHIVFKKKTGMTPQNFRNSAKNRLNA